MAVDDDASLYHVIGCLLARRLQAVPALVREKVPNWLTIRTKILLKPDELVGIEGEILRILVAAHVFCLGSRQLVPLLASNLAAAASYTHRRINEKCLSAHSITSFLYLSDIDHKGLGFRDPGIGVSNRWGEQVG